MTEPSQVPEPQHSETPPSSGFDFNRPTIIAGLYGLGYFTLISSLIGVVLCYVWRSEPGQTWELSHYDYHIRTFWGMVIGSVVGFLLLLILIGFLIWVVVAIWALIRVVLSIVNAQKREPMPNPHTLLF